MAQQLKITNLFCARMFWPRFVRLFYPVLCMRSEGSRDISRGVYSQFFFVSLRILSQDSRQARGCVWARKDASAGLKVDVV